MSDALYIGALIFSALFVLAVLMAVLKFVSDDIREASPANPPAAHRLPTNKELLCEPRESPETSCS